MERRATLLHRTFIYFTSLLMACVKRIFICNNSVLNIVEYLLFIYVITGNNYGRGDRRHVGHIPLTHTWHNTSESRIYGSAPRIKDTVSVFRLNRFICIQNCFERLNNSFRPPIYFKRNAKRERKCYVFSLWISSEWKYFISCPLP